MKYIMADHTLWSCDRLIRLSIYFVAALGISLLFCVVTASGDEVKIKKIGDRVLLYESASVYYLQLAETLPKAGDEANFDVDEWAEGTQHQAAMYAFMFFIDRTRAQPSRDDKYFRSLIRTSHGLMAKVDWAEFEKYVRFMGFAHADGFFVGYKREMLEKDLGKFKEFVRRPTEKVIDETSAPGSRRSAPSQPPHGKGTPEPSPPNGGSKPRQPPEEPPAEPDAAPK